MTFARFLARALLALGLTSTLACAQSVDDKPDWVEGDVPPPPAFDAQRVIPLDPPAGSALTIGIDPATLTISATGVVRYVVIARSPSGAMNVMYEGIRCTTSEFRVYARFQMNQGWRSAGDSPWMSLFDPLPSRHALALARAGVCIGNSAPSAVPAIVRTLRAPTDKYLTN